MVLRKYLLLLLSLCIYAQASAQLKGNVAINEKFFGQNYWMPNKAPYTGDLQTYWQEIRASGVQYVRVGGKDYDKTDMWPITDLIQIIDEIRSYGMEPIIQVPINDQVTLASNVTTCENLVEQVNGANFYNRGVIYWEIGNEPDGAYTVWNTPALIRDYILAVSPAMKAKSSIIKIIAPSTASFNPQAHPNAFNDFIGGSADITGSISQGVYYVDYIAFNTYPMKGETYLASKNRGDIIKYPRDLNKLKDDLVHLKSLIQTAGRTGTMSIAITEFNISYEQDRNNKAITGIGPGSYIAGQFVSEMMSIGMEEGVEIMCLWSVTEGTNFNSSNYLTDIGYIGSEFSDLRSMYWHYKLLANYFRSAPGFTTKYYQGSTTGTALKAFCGNLEGTKQTIVVLMNQTPDPANGNTSATYNYSIELDGTGTGTGTNPVTISFATLPSSLSGLTRTGTIAAQTTQVHVFDCNGSYAGMWEYDINDATNGKHPRWIPDAAPYLTLTSTPAFSSVTLNASSNACQTFTFGGASTYSSFPVLGQAGTGLTPGPNPNQAEVCASSGQTNVYSLIASNSSGCVSMHDITVPDGSPVNASGTCPITVAFNTTNITCPGMTDGATTVVASNTSGTVTYSWSHGPTTASIASLAEGSYQVTVTDNVCSKIASVYVSPYDHPNGITITTNTTWSSNKRIKGAVRIKAPAKLTVNNNAVIEFADDYVTMVEIEPGAKMHVEGGAKLTSLQGCNKMWLGVQVWGKSSKRQIATEQGFFIVKNATLENMRMGVINRRYDFVNPWPDSGDPYYWTTGGIIQGVNATFRNNVTSVCLWPYTNKTLQNQPLYSSQYGFNNCTFEITSAFPDPAATPGKQFLTLGNYGIKFMGCTFQNTAPGLFTFSQQGWGIYSVMSGFTVDQRCTNSQISPCPSFAPSKFINMSYGIYAINTSALHQVYVRNSEFMDNTRAITLKGTTNPQVVRNYIDVGAQEIESSSTYDPYGLYLEQCTGYKVDENEFTNNMFGSTAVGTAIYQSGDLPNKTYNNTYDNLQVGVLVMGDNRGVSASDGLFIKCNDFGQLSGECMYDIALTEVNLVPANIAQAQGSNIDITAPAGNRFSHTCNFPTSEYSASASTQPINYTHHNDYMAQPICYETSVVTTYQASQSFVKNQACPTSFTDCSHPCLISNMQKAQSQAEYYNEALVKGDAQQLIDVINTGTDADIERKLMDASPYLSDRVLLAAINKPEPLAQEALKNIIVANSKVSAAVMRALGQIEMAEEYMAEINTAQENPSQRAIREGVVAHYKGERFLALNARINLFQEDTTTGGLDSIIALLRMERDHDHQAQLAAAFVQKESYDEAMEIIEAHTHNGEELCLVHSKTIQAVTGPYGYHTLRYDQTLASEVEAIAAKNTMGSVQAQALLEMAFGKKAPETIVLPGDSRARLAKPAGQEEINGTALRNYPNPFTEGTVVEAVVPGTVINAELVIYDVMGKEVKRHRLQAGQNTINISMETLEAGIYIYSIVADAEKLATGRMVYLTR